MLPAGIALAVVATCAALLYLLLRARARRQLRRAAAAYEAERWSDCVGHYRDYLLGSAFTLHADARKEILRRMAYAAMTGDLNTNLRPAIVEFMQLDGLAPRRRIERDAQEKYYAARGRLLAVLRRLDISPRGPESGARPDPGCLE